MQTVPTYVALLRGVNVGGKGQVPMAELRKMFEALGHTDVATYIQSGNVVFTSAKALKSAAPIEAALTETFGLKSAVVLRTPAELAAVIEHNPYPEAEAVPSALHVTFLPSPPDKAQLAKVDASSFAPEEFTVHGRDVYLHLPDGMGRSKLAPVLTRRLGPAATARNWNTVKKLLAMSQG
jgi:uncharacterized protein (DUF1697 family)